MCISCGSYYSDLIHSKSGDQRALFSIVNNLFDKSKASSVLPQHDSSKDLSNKFNNFYINKVAKLRNEIPQSTTHFNPTFYSKFQGKIMDSFETTTLPELRKILK